MAKTMKYILLCFCCVSLIGCANTQNIPLTKERAALLKGHTVAAVQSPAPDFVAMTRVKSMFGAVGALGMVAEGNAIVHEDNVNDPAREIGSDLTKAVAKGYGSKVINLPLKKGEAGSVAAISKNYKESDFLMDVKTTSWGCAFDPYGWDKYYVIYTVTLRLIDTRTQTVLCQGYFPPNRTEKSDPYSFEDLTGNQGAILKHVLKQYTDRAIQFFKTETLGVK